MTTANIIAIAAAAVSFGSMCAAIGSAWFAKRNARIAEQAKEQARQAATLAPRGEVIGHVYAAMIGLKQGSPFSPEVIPNLEKAKLDAARVFGREITDDLERKLEKARAHAANAHDPSWSDLIIGLEDLMARMNKAAYLGPTN